MDSLPPTGAGTENAHNDQQASTQAAVPAAPPAGPAPPVTQGPASDPSSHAAPAASTSSLSQSDPAAHHAAHQIPHYPVFHAPSSSAEAAQVHYISENQVTQTPAESQYPAALKAYEKAFARALKATDITPEQLHAACENYFSKILIIKRAVDRADSFWQHLEIVKVLDATTMLSKDVKLRHNAENCNVLLSGINPSRHNAKGGRFFPSFLSG